MIWKKNSLHLKILTEAQIKNTQTEKGKTKNWNLWCKNSEEGDRNENDFERDNLSIYYNWHAVEWDFIHSHLDRFRMSVLWYDNKKNSKMEQTKAISSFFMKNHWCNE